MKLWVDHNRATPVDIATIALHRYCRESFREVISCLKLWPNYILAGSVNLPAESVGIHCYNTSNEISRVVKYWLNYEIARFINQSPTCLQASPWQVRHENCTDKVHQIEA